MPQLTFSISDTKFAKFKEGFLKRHPIPLDEDRNPIMAENAWVKEAIKRLIQTAYNEGRKMIYREMQETPEDMVE